MVWPTLLLSLPAYAWGYRLRGRKLFWKTFPLGAPALLFALYYTHVFDGLLSYDEFRSLPGIELTGALVGVPIGTLARRRAHDLLLIVGMLLLVWIPYAKPALRPLDYSLLQSRWKDNVAAQSVGATCGPCCVATLLRYYGYPSSEAELASECFTSAGGTENWYMARALRRRELRVNYHHLGSGDLPSPSILGVKLPTGAGHFIMIFQKQGDLYDVGDPMRGRRKLNIGVVQKEYALTGFAMIVNGKFAGNARARVKPGSEP
jgi:hypothetical protein